MTGKDIQELIDNYQGSGIYNQLKLYSQYYMTKNPSLMKRIKDREYQRKTPNWCVPTAYFGTVIDTHAGYLFSNVQYDSQDETMKHQCRKCLT